MTPQTQKQWVVGSGEGLQALRLEAAAPVPCVGEREVLVKIHAVSLNFRDLLIAKGLYPFQLKDNLVPVSDGEVLLLLLDLPSRNSGLGGALDGVLREYAAFPEEGLVSVPKNLSLQEAASLPCAALTAWSALYGHEGRAIRPGDTVLTEGTGGVSTFAVQFARSAGVNVIATTSSNEKVAKLKELGADHVINYKENPKWGEEARGLTQGNEGVTLVVEVGGPASLRQALEALKIDGLVSMVGSVSGYAAPGHEPEPTFLETVLRSCTVKGISVGSRQQFEEMNRAIEAHDIHPVLDAQVFKMEQAPEAFQYLWDQKHFGKVIIQIV